ncbi:alanine dehydrogenase, partial [Streptomyces prasinus]|uniref:alanine dehydrogenase n=1 Tax=Streptomyces prasinus TaxID=67345 RepID=UPI003636DCB7
PLWGAGGGRGGGPGGVRGGPRGRAAVIGGGVSGWSAAQIAVGMGFHVTLLDKDIDKLREADRVFGTKIQTVVSNTFELEKACVEADLVIGAVLIPGARAPKLVTNDLVSRMKSGSVLVDIAIDQGGCFEDSRPTTHAEPTFAVHDSVFYCVANMPGAVPATSTYALTNATLPYVVELADRGWMEALRRDPALAKGLNTHDGEVVHREVAAAHGLDHVELAALLR